MFKKLMSKKSLAKVGLLPSNDTPTLCGEEDEDELPGSNEVLVDEGAQIWALLG